MSGQEAFAARKKVIADIERESLNKTKLRSDVVSLYQGGEYWLYQYKKYTDVRLVFAPEQQIAFFGGDPDNFTYPRYDLDMAIFRVYENNKPLHTENYLKWNATGAGDDELVFVAGHPGSTQRNDTMAQLITERDIVEPNILRMIKGRLDVLKSYAAQGSEQARQSASEIFGWENSQKAYIGRLAGLQDKNVLAKKQKEEEDFKARVMANPQWAKEASGAWDEIAQAEAAWAPRAKWYFFRSLDSTLAQRALQIVRYVAEVKKPDGERLPGYHEAQLESLRQVLFSPAPIYPAMEIARMAGGLELSRQELGPDDEWLKTVLNGKEPVDLARDVISKTKVAEPAFRKQLVEGGVAAVEASTDPLISLACKIDPIGREMIKWRENHYDSIVTRAGERLGRARFLAYGKSIYPDATFTLRLSYGAAKGYPMNGTKAPYKTTLYGLYDRAASFNFVGPFDLPSRWKEGRNQLNLSTPMDFVSTNDIIGGNSGSPVINQKAELVGLIFDGNIESLVGDFVYDPTANRAVAVHSGAMIEALRKLYDAGKLADELQGIGPSGTK
jgi:Peptidase S46